MRRLWRLFFTRNWVPAHAGPLEDVQAAFARGDYATALKFWRPLAEQGNATTQSNLGFMYSEGLGVPQDYDEAVKWLRMATEQGDADAQFNLGVMYRDGGDFHVGRHYRCHRELQ